MSITGTSTLVYKNVVNQIKFGKKNEKKNPVKNENNTVKINYTKIKQIITSRYIKPDPL